MIQRALVAAIIAIGAGNQGLAQSGPPSGLVKTRLMPPTYAVTAPDYALKNFARPSETADATYAYMAEKTRLILSPSAPLQVSYTDRSGSVTLWFPESGQIMRGKWSIEEKRWQLMENGVAIKTRSDFAVCFDYSGPIPNIFAPEWQRGLCSPLRGVRERSIDRREGDIFGLAAGQPRRPLGPLNVRKLADLVARF